MTQPALIASHSRSSSVTAKACVHCIDGMRYYIEKHSLISLTSDRTDRAIQLVDKKFANLSYMWVTAQDALMQLASKRS